MFLYVLHKDQIFQEISSPMAVKVSVNLFLYNQHSRRSAKWSILCIWNKNSSGLSRGTKTKNKKTHMKKAISSLKYKCYLRDSYRFKLRNCFFVKMENIVKMYRWRKAYCLDSLADILWSARFLQPWGECHTTLLVCEQKKKIRISEYNTVNVKVHVMKRLGSKNCHLESKTEKLGMGCELMAGVAARGEVLEWRLSLEKARLPTLYNRRLQGMCILMYKVKHNLCSWTICNMFFTKATLTVYGREMRKKFNRYLGLRL